MPQFFLMECLILPSWNNLLGYIVVLLENFIENEI